VKKVLHISTECYPVAKAGGMADVVGALPLYQKKLGWEPSVIIPRYDLKWYQDKTFKEVYSDTLTMEGQQYDFSIVQCIDHNIDYHLYLVDLPELFMRDSIYLNDEGYGFHDEPERNMGFQRATLQWLSNTKEAFDLLHCHDHQTGFIPFMIQHGTEYKRLSKTPTVYTVHNAAYNSRYPWERKTLLPKFKEALIPSIDWDNCFDAVASAMRYAAHVNTVSPSYLTELLASMKPLKIIYGLEPDKFSGILNGIDAQTWDPKKDERIPHKLGRSWDTFKNKNKSALLSTLYRAEDVPMISFIGRFAHQKGADLLRPVIEQILTRFGFVNFFILGSGDRHLEHSIQGLRDRHPERVGCYIGYNEDVAHQVYAASDFILMPSRFEPCGLNQMFAMRYGTIPIARATGGLKDTVIDFESGGTGISFTHDTPHDLSQAISRAMYLIKDKDLFKTVRDKAIAQNYSWEASTKTYISTYNRITQ
jgi:starch synthase